MTVLLIVLGCLGLVDYKYHLAMFRHPVRASIILLVLVVLFAIWDIAGIQAGIFRKGSSPLLLGIDIIDNFPIEEIAFLLVLHYTALLAWTYTRSRYA